MKLIFDENLSYKLCALLSDIFPNSVHIKQIGLENEDDKKIWDFARNNDYTVVSKDSDFIEMSFIIQNPPKIIWVTAGNVSTSHIEKILRNNLLKIISFHKNKENYLLILK